MRNMNSRRFGLLALASALMAAAPALTQTSQLRFTGYVYSTAGMSPVQPNTRCGIVVTPVTQGQLNCRIQVQCGDLLMYGTDGQGYDLCSYHSEQTGLFFHGSETTITAEDTHITPEDGDPRMSINIPHGDAVISDGADAAHVWAVRIRGFQPAD